ncbi:MAG: DUF4173 domain-containing protein [Bacilli bacterium]|nr:DUF4173 domain-containing protein [Bacilli bacterium]
MEGLIIYILLLSIYNCVLFYGKSLGINVLLFNIPLLIFMIKRIKNNKKKINKKGFLFGIPIILISLSYFLYNNIYFNLLNLFVITGLFLLMYVYTINPKNNIFHMIGEFMNLLFMPLASISELFKNVKKKISSIITLSDRSKKIIKSLIIIFPIVVIILILLTSADKEFNNMFIGFYKLLDKISIHEVVGRIVYIFLLFVYLGAANIFLLKRYKKENKKSKFQIEDVTVKILLTALNVIYIVFDIIQIKSLFLHNLSLNISYAEYARHGFFRLMVISVINVTLLLISKHSKNKDSRYNKIMSLLMVILTTIIIASSFMRMHLYESTYGYTLLRLLVYYILITETVLLIPTIIYIFKNKFNVLNVYIVIITISYVILNFIPVNYIIARNNVDRYYKSKSIDLGYLENHETDNIIILRELYDRTEEDEIKKEIKEYFKEVKKYNKIHGFQEFNISKITGINIIKKVD